MEKSFHCLSRIDRDMIDQLNLGNKSRETFRVREGQEIGLLHYFEIITQEINRKNGKQFVVLFWKLHCHLDIRCYALFAYS